MGAWGTAVFSDDTACDVRDRYIDLMGAGLSGPEATRRLIHEWAESLDDPDEGPVFWLALAATQWKKGRLEPDVLREALGIIDNGTDLARWKGNSRDYRKRQAALERLRAQLISPQPPSKPIPKRFRDSNDWQPGALVSYRLLSGQLILLRVIGHHSDMGGMAPICELLDWIGSEVPENLESLSVRRGAGTSPVAQFMIGRTRANERPENRLRRLGINQKPSQKPSGFTVLLWRQLDNWLKEKFSIA
jgi:hypothetical protein